MNTENVDAVKTEIKISVIMPIYNARDYLRPALDSVLDQTLREIELICVDDGSTDKSLDVIREYQKRDSRIRIITETNAGPARARNFGLRRARGEYVAFLDADDFYEPDMLEELYKISKTGDLDIAIAQYDIYNSKKACFRANVESDESVIYREADVTSKNEHPESILQSTSGFAWNKLFKKSFLSEKKLTFLEEVKMFEDVYFTVCAMAFAERVGKVHRVLAHHRIYNEQTRAKVYKKYFAQVPMVYEKIKEFLMKGGMYQPIIKSFFNLCASRCYYIYGLIPPDAKEVFWNLLHEEYAQKLGWYDVPVSDISNDNVSDFISNVLLYNNSQYKKRLSKGVKNPDKERMNIYLTRHNKRERIKSFLSGVFGKNKPKRDKEL